MKRFLCAAAAAGVLAFAAPATAQKASMGDLFPSVVRVGVIHEDGYSLGSGAVVSRDAQGSFVVTNYHVIEGAGINSIRVLAPKVGTTGANGAAEVEEVTATYWGGDPSSDLAILYVKNFFREPLTLATGPAIEDMPVRSIGYPVVNDMQWRKLNRTPALRDGIVSTVATAPWSPGRPAVGQIQHTADLDKGMSGGPLVDLCGRIIGLNTAYNASANSSYMALSASDVIPYLNKSNLNFKQVATTCDPSPKPLAPPPPPPGPTPAEIAAAKAAKAQADLLTWGGVGAGVVALAGLGFLAWRFGKTRRPPPPPAGPPHGLILRGVNESAGFTLLFRSEDIAVEGGAAIGRTATFGSAGTSRQHARLSWSPDGGFALLDVGTVNGTRVNGGEIKGLGPRPVKVGDVIEFGARDARYTLERL